ncbi:MAG TPA: hypothetical protein VLX92_12100 [Kofleriaceae bacterium]|nr:hypothetical protein [Kofleriaceae bacterium]
MTRALLVIALASCHKPDPPDPAAYARMSHEARCEATLARGASCADELLREQVRSFVHGSDGDLDDLTRRPSNSDDAASIYRVLCVGAPDNEVADAVVACWSRTSCDDFAACVTRATR